MLINSKYVIKLNTNNNVKFHGFVTETNRNGEYLWMKFMRDILQYTA